MKKLNSVWVFTGGILLGVSVMLCLGAAGKETAPAKKDWSHLQVVTYASGVTGFFDPVSGKLFMYDANLQNCYLVRQINTLGEPLSRP